MCVCVRVCVCVCERERERERERNWLNMYFSPVKILAQRPAHIIICRTTGNQDIRKTNILSISNKNDC